MKVGMTGSSTRVTAQQLDSFRSLLLWLAADQLHHGDCIVADAEAHKLAGQLGLQRVIHPPEDPKKRAYCSGERTVVLEERPYLERNHQIVRATDVLVALPEELYTERTRSGTWSTVRYARKLGRQVYIIRPDGTIVDDNESCAKQTTVVLDKESL